MQPQHEFWFRELRERRQLTHIHEMLHTIQDQLDLVITQGAKLMAVADDIKAAIATLNTETTAIGTLITALAAKIKNGMTDQEVADIKASFGTLSDRLTSLAVDPTNPVPPPPAPLQALKKKLP